ncbi:MAG TPA: hypothetical protein VFW91_12560 [Candidatus Binatia bacterium]|jgi:hypothetical protein|nr:hypothetical protein [Candidatus Binatia bacterium]
MELSSVATAFPVIPPEFVPIAFDLSSTAADLFSILRDLCVAGAALNVATQFPSVSFKLFEIAAQLPVVPPNLSIILVQFLVILSQLLKIALDFPIRGKSRGADKQLRMTP